MHFRRSKLVSGALAVLVGLGLAAVPATSADAQRGPAAAPALNWQPCASSADFQCATMTVPLDYDQPAGPTIGVAVIRHLAEDPAHRAGSVFWNAGGPGGAPTTGLPLVYSQFPAQLRARFDIVSMDPRGIGASDQLRCFATPEQESALLGQLPPGFPVGPAETQKAISIYAQFDQACARNGGPIQYHMGTADVARDMDTLRATIGESTLNYYGPSYGSYLGVTYANLFPRNVGHILLDGNVPPVEWNDAKLGAKLNTFIRIGSPFGAEVALQTMLRQCGAVDPSRCAFSAGSADATVAKYRTLLQRLTSAPVTLDGTVYTYALTASTVASLLGVQNPGPLGPGWTGLAVLMQTLFAQSAPGARHVGSLPTGLRRTLERKSSPASLATAFDAQLPEGTDGVLCGESPNPREPQSYTAQAKFADVGTPDGLGDVWTSLARPCAQWQARDQDTYTGPWNRSTEPYLLVGTLADPNTAYTGTLSMAAETGNARVLTETGGGHTALLNKSDCVDGYIGRFFLDGSLPPAGTVCHQNAPPF